MSGSAKEIERNEIPEEVIPGVNKRDVILVFAGLLAGVPQLSPPIVPQKWPKSRGK